MKATTLGIVLIIGAMTLLCSCSSGTPGQARPDSTSNVSPATSSSASLSQAPKVAASLDATRFVNEPCLSLTSADLAGLGITKAMSGGNQHNVGGVGCTWSGESGGGVDIGWETAITNGLSDLYSKSNTIAYWQPTTVSGYPAAYGDGLGDGRAIGDCVINVGVNDHLYFMSDFDNSVNAGQSCALAERAAADVIANLRGAA